MPRGPSRWTREGDCKGGRAGCEWSAASRRRILRGRRSAPDGSDPPGTLSRSVRQEGRLMVWCRRPRIVTALLAVAALAVSYAVHGAQPVLAAAGSPDSTYDSLFDSYSNNATCADWSGGDATNSVQLPSGDRAWFFSDSFLGSPADRKTLWYASSLHNSIVIQSGSSLHTITGGNTCQERNTSLSFWSRYATTPAAAGDQSSGGFYWTGDQMVVGSNVVKFYYHGNHSVFPFAIDSWAIATIPVSTLETAVTVT